MQRVESVNEEAWLTEPYIYTPTSGSSNNKRAVPWTCLLCNSKGRGLPALGRHCSGSMHNKKLKKLLEDPYLEENTNPGNDGEDWKCVLCHTGAMTREALKKHCSGAHHLSQLRILLESHFANMKSQQKYDLQWLDEPYIQGSVNEKTQEEQWTCSLCGDKKQMTLAKLGIHCRGTAHNSKLKALEDSYLEIHRDHWKCLVCKERVKPSNIAIHYKSERHQKRFRKLLSYSYARSEEKKPEIAPLQQPEEEVPQHADCKRDRVTAGTKKMDDYRGLQERIAALGDAHQQWHINHLLVQDLLYERTDDDASSPYLSEAMHALEQYESNQERHSFVKRLVRQMNTAADNLCCATTYGEPAGTSSPTIRGEDEARQAADTDVDVDPAIPTDDPDDEDDGASKTTASSKLPILDVIVVPKVPSNALPMPPPVGSHEEARDDGENSETSESWASSNVFSDDERSSDLWKKSSGHDHDKRAKEADIMGFIENEEKVFRLMNLLPSFFVNKST